MQLSFRRPPLLRACPWASYALLRDAVQHFLEDGQPTAQFASLHGLEIAVDEGRCVVSAVGLRFETLHAWRAVGGISAAETALSLRTWAILSSAPKAPLTRKTFVVDRANVRPSAPIEPEALLFDSVRPFVLAVLELTDLADESETVEVWRQGPPPRYARKALIARLHSAVGQLSRVTRMS